MAIHGYDGVPGSGKTASMVQRGFLRRHSGTAIYANIPLYELRMWLGKPLRPEFYGFPWGVYIANAEDLLTVRRGTVLLDEVDMWFAAVEWQRIGFEARRAWTQSRKQGLDIFWACTFFDNVLNVVRNITSRVNRCHEIPFFKNKRLIKAFNPQETSTTRKASSFQLVTLRPDLFGLYNSAFIVGNGEKQADGLSGSIGEMGGDFGAAMDVRPGVWEDWVEIAMKSRTVYLLAPNRDGSHNTAPLLGPEEVRRGRVWVRERTDPVQCKRFCPDERVAALRLARIVAGLTHRETKGF